MENKKINFLTIGFIVLNIASYLISNNFSHRYVSINNYASVLGGEFLDLKGGLYEFVFILIISTLFYFGIKSVKNKVFRIALLAFAFIISVPIISLYGL